MAAAGAGRHSAGRVSLSCVFLCRPIPGGPTFWLPPFRYRHGRACPGHPRRARGTVASRLTRCRHMAKPRAGRTAWVAGTSPAMTVRPSAALAPVEHCHCRDGTRGACEGGAPLSPNRWAASARGNQSRQGRRCKRGWRRADRVGGGGRVRRGRRGDARRLQAGRRAHPQHPAERPQEAPGLRGGGDEGRHLRLGEQVLQLRTPVGGIRHQPHQPGEAMRQRPGPLGPRRPRRWLCRTRVRCGPAPQPARVEAGGDSGEAAGDAAQPRPDQDDERPREPPPGDPRGHAPAQPVDKKGEAVGRGGRSGGVHDSMTNTTGAGVGKRDFRPGAS